MRKAEWVKSGNGPDWMDIEMALRVIDGVHLGTTVVTISPLGIGSSGGLRLVIATTWPQLPGSQGLGLVESESVWPCREGGTLEGHIFRGIYRHDFAIGEAYQQRSFKEA